MKGRRLALIAVLCLSGTAQSVVAFEESELMDEAAAQDLEDDLMLLDDALSGSDEYAGSYIDRTEGVVLTVLTTAPVSQESLPEVDDPSKLTFRVVEHSLAELRATYEALKAAWVDGAESLRDVVEISLEVEENRVRVAFMDGTSGAAEVTAGRVPGPLASSFPTNAIGVEVVAEPAQLRDRDCNNPAVPPIFGGYGYADRSLTCGAGFQSFCTTGFQADRGGYPTTDWLLTAGHCLKVAQDEFGWQKDDPAFHGQSQIGFRGVFDFPGHDFGLIRVPNQSLASDDIERNGAAIDVVGTTTNYSEGLSRCVVGISTPTSCGPIDASLVSLTCDGFLIVDMVRVSIATADGTSGGPLYRYVQQDNNAYAAGTLSCGNGSLSWYSRLDQLPSGWNITISTSP